MFQLPIHLNSAAVSLASLHTLLPASASFVPTLSQSGLQRAGIAPFAGADEPDRNGEDGGLAVQEARPRLKEPPMYKVVLLNDDYTPMDFVVQVLEQFFAIPRTKATQIMLEVHTKGKGVCGVFTAEIAETKVAQVNDFSRSNQHPLMCSMEPA